MASGNSIIGALSVVLGVDTATFETGLKSAATKLGVFAGVGIAAGEALGRVLGGAIRDLALSVPKTITQFDNLSKTSQKIGVPVEMLAALQHAAELSDVSSEALTKGLGKLARSAVDAAQGSTTAVAAYRALGVSFRDVNGGIKPVGELLPQIADKFARMKDGSAKTALAMQIFGKAGADLIPMLNGGSAGLKEMTAEAKALGLVISGETAVTAENFNDNLTRLGNVVKGVVVQFTANILPALAQFSQFLIDSAKNSGFLQAAVSVLTTGFNGFARAAIILYDNIKPLAQLIGLWVGSGILLSLGSAAISVGLAFVKLTAVTRTLGLTMAAFEAIRSISVRGLLFLAGIVALASGAFDGFSDKIKSLGGWLTDILPEGAGEKAAEIMKALGLNLEGLTADLKSWKAESGKSGALFDPNIIKTSKDALDSYINSKQKQIAALKAELPLIGQSNVAVAQAKIVAEGLAIAQANHIPITEALKQKLTTLAQTFATLNEAVSFGKTVFEQTRTPLEQYQDTIEKLNVSYNAGAINANTYARAVAQAQDKMVQANPYAQALGNSLTTAFDSAIQRGSKLSDVLKQLLVDLSRAWANAAFKQFLFGNASTGGTSAGVMGIFKGLFGMASGGSFEVGSGPGVFSGVDSQLVAFKARPGEQVNVTKPGQMGGGAGGYIYAPQYNFSPGMTPADMASIRAQMAMADKATEERTIGRIRRAHQTDSGFLNG